MLAALDCAATDVPYVPVSSRSHAPASDSHSSPSERANGFPPSRRHARASGARVSSDVLSDVLRAVRLTGAVYFDFELSSPWVAEAPRSQEIAPTVMPGAQRVIEYHLIARGACWGQVAGHEPMRLNEGDLLVLPQGDAHTLSSALGMRATPDLSMFARPTTPLPIVYELGGGGPERTRIVCGFLGCDERPFNPLLTALPAVIHLPASGQQATSGWLATILNIAVRESGSARAGSENILARLSELMFVEAVRRYIEALPAAGTGWLAGLRDPVVGQALAALHAEPTEAWTVEGLARPGGVSRAVRMFLGQVSRVVHGEVMRPMKTTPPSGGINAGSFSNFCSPSRASNISRGPVIPPSHLF